MTHTVDSVIPLFILSPSVFMFLALNELFNGFPCVFHRHVHYNLQYWVDKLGQLMLAYNNCKYCNIPLFNSVLLSNQVFKSDLKLKIFTTSTFFFSSPVFFLSLSLVRREMFEWMRIRSVLVGADVRDAEIAGK